MAKSISLNFSPRCALSCRPLYSYQRYHSPKNDYEDEHTQPVHFSNNNHRGTGFQNSSSTAAPRLAPPTPPHRCTAAPPQHCLLDPACQCDSARIAFQRHPKLPSRQRFHTRLEASGGGGGESSSTAAAAQACFGPTVSVSRVIPEHNKFGLLYPTRPT